MNGRPQTFRRLTRRHYGRAMNRARRAGRSRTSIERYANRIAARAWDEAEVMLTQALMTGSFTWPRQLVPEPVPGQTGHFV